MGAAVGHQPSYLLRADGPAEVVTLTELAALLREECELPLGFDTFGDGLERQLMCNRQDRAADRLSVFAGSEIRHEGTIDLEHVEGESTQIAQTRVARTEIVDCEPEPDVL